MTEGMISTDSASSKPKGHPVAGSTSRENRLPVMKTFREIFTTQWSERPRQCELGPGVPLRQSPLTPPLPRSLPSVAGVQAINFISPVAFLPRYWPAGLPESLGFSRRASPLDRRHAAAAGGGAVPFPGPAPMPPMPPPSLPSRAVSTPPLLAPTPAAGKDNSLKPSLLSLLPGTSSTSSEHSRETVRRAKEGESLRTTIWGRCRSRRTARNYDPKTPSQSPESSQGPGPTSSSWGSNGMATAVLGAGLARILFYPTLLGALPLRSLTRRLVEEENVRGVITMNEEYETRFLCNTYEEWKATGVEQLRLSTVDMTGVPTLENLKKGVRFTLEYTEQGKCVYIHCKAGRSRSATMVAAYLMKVYNCSPEEAIKAIAKIRSHIHVRSRQVEVLKEFYKELLAEAEKSKA
uniref:Phosphatidylglycerophosphatase and protein-tyrosine phosphatase 1 n=1 Tax=Monodelphis domestica TaxID=13616 RepID=F6VPI0_MONDO